MNIDKRQVDWEEEFEDWDLMCPFCEGEGKITEDNQKNYTGNYDIGDWCDECTEGRFETYWNTVWDVGYMGGREAINEETVKKVIRGSGCLLLFNHEEDKWYLTLGGCGMDLTPHMCYAWLLIGFNWLPQEWTTSLSKDYRANLSEDAFKQVLDLAVETLESDISDCKTQIEKLRA
ncbi:hypothetical protein LCGC14_1522160 [marine sediment metagenome]|uniref:Uncharacterized protein n=1 Tax=marine sediment metagenome TaxID=412755 RepID=A0A0F9LE02_9ZZZZ